MNEKTDESNIKPSDSAISEENHSKYRIIYRYSLLAAISFFQVFAFILSFYTVNEYAYDFIRRQEYPEVTLNKSSESLCTRNSSQSEKNIEDAIQSKVSQWSVYVSLASGIPAVFSILILPTLSDKYGRKRFLYITVGGTVFKNTLIALGIYLKLSINWFILFYVVDGATGNWVLTLSVSFAYIADMTTQLGKDRTMYMVSYELSFQLASSIAGFISGFYVDSVGFLYPVITAAASGCLAFLCTIILPDSVRINSGSRNKRIVEYLHDIVKFLYKNEDGQRTKYILCIFSMLFIWMGGLGQANVMIYFIMGDPFCFNEVLVSIYSTSTKVFQQIFGVIITKILKYFLTPEVITLFASSSSIATYVVMGSAQSVFMLILASIVGGFSLGAIPLLRAIVSSMTKPDKQGAVFALVAFFENISGLAGPSISGAVYSRMAAVMRGFAFFVMAIYSFISLVILAAIVFVTKRDKKYKNLQEEEIPNICANE